MKFIKSVELGLENCEGIKFNTEEIGTIYVGDIKQTISRVACNAISKNLFCDTFYIEIHKSANKMDRFLTDWSEILPFDRLLQHRDIATITINYEDETSECYCVNWTGDYDWINESQSGKLNEKTGDLYIVVSPNEAVDRVFEDELIQDESNWYFDKSE